MRVAAYTVRADAHQAVRWQRNAAAEGFPSVGAWIAVTVERYLKLRARPVPLHWREARFVVALDCGDMQVKGSISPPFATFRGTAAGPTLSKTNVHTLVYLEPGKAGRVLATVQCRRDARVLAVELARSWMQGEPGEAFRAALTGRRLDP
ncbi:MAG TPA: hypothetical protein VNJ70_14750 [Thermoanaerobaculia bacterium]|nr:hypothetical protein [Thermoanaerobaculia bacterium]